MTNRINKQMTQRDNYSEPLIFIAEASVAIFPDKIVQYKRKQKCQSMVETTVFSVNSIDLSDKIIHFATNDIAFKIEEGLKRIQIIQLKHQKVELDFTIEKTSQLIIIQQILRRKLCQIGFEQKYIKMKELGKGATAKVYLVQRKSDGKYFAAKIMSLKDSDNKDYDTFVNQTKILKCLKNKYIVAIQSLYISKKELISVLQYLNGGTLLEELKNDKVKSETQKFKAIKEITEGIEHLRQKRIIHRDLKLENVMVRINSDKSKDYVITDFGLACWIGQKQLLYQKCGTPGYIAPEILRSSKGKVLISHASDIFSLGVICHFIFLLKSVFPYNGNPKDLLILNKKATFSLQTKYHLNLLPSQLQILHRTLQIDPLKRASSQQLLNVDIKKYQKQILFIQGNKKKRPHLLIDKKQENQNLIKKHRISNSIEMIQKRAPSMDKNQLSNRIKTEKSQQKTQKQDSVGKFINKVWNKISSSKSEVLKKKEEPNSRKRQMKNFIS